MPGKPKPGSLTGSKRIPSSERNTIGPGPAVGQNEETYSAGASSRGPWNTVMPR